MKLKDLKCVLYSNGAGNIQWAIVWDVETAKDLEHGCSIEYAIAHYGERTVSRISAYDSYIVIEI